MTTHVLVVNDNTFKYHLEYMFAGTGPKEPKTEDKQVTKQKILDAKLNASLEKVCIGLMADWGRVRKGDYIFFYVVQGYDQGKFYGIFKASDNGVSICDKGEYLLEKLDKTLPFRMRIEPYKVYPLGITEWEALDEIKELQAPCQMLWSLIYRKLKGKRGNTMITLYEASRLNHLISRKNNYKCLIGNDYTYDREKICISTSHFEYKYQDLKIDILSRLIKKNSLHQKFEVYLQMYITQNLGLGVNKTLDEALNIKADKLEWLGNEVSCGVGMQKIDIMFSKKIDESEHLLVPIELKAVGTEEYNVNQIRRYVEWIEQYYIPNTASIIQPVLICKKSSFLDNQIFENFKRFNSEKHGLPLIFIEYEIKNDNIFFEKVDY